MKSKIALAQRMLAMLLCVLMLTGSVIPAAAQDGHSESGTENAQTLQQKPEPQQPEVKPEKPEEKPETPEEKPEKPEEKLGKPEEKPDNGVVLGNIFQM